jgi:electron transfer flavoprotein-quinone oxidoreductase
MSEDKMDAVIVGGGLAGLCAAYRLLEAGRQVILLERGDTCGSKNVTGGRIYVGPLRRYIPAILEEAPFERPVVKEIVTLLDEGSSVQVEHVNDRWRQPPYMSYTVLRAAFDNWLSEKVVEKGGFVIPKRRVDGLLFEDGRVAGVKVGDEEIPANIVIAADGALSFMAEKAGLRKPHAPADYAVAVKEVYKLDAGCIEERFGLEEGRGAAGLFAGSVTKGMFGGGFLYTNKESVSAGIVVGIGAFLEHAHDAEMHRLMDGFTGRPEVARFLKDGELKEYSAHIISEAGYGGLARLYTGGMLVAGDAAGLALNMGLTVRGMDFAVASGVIAAEAADEALSKGDFSAATLSVYEKRLKGSFVLKDMETFRHSREVLENPRFLGVYPRFLCELFEALFTIGEGPKGALYGSARKIAGRYMLNWQGFKDFLSLRRM